MSGKRYSVKQMLEPGHIEYANPLKQQRVCHKTDENAINLNKESAKKYRKEEDHSIILKQNDQKLEWATVQEEFQEAECGGNLPVG